MYVIAILCNVFFRKLFLDFSRKLFASITCIGSLSSFIILVLYQSACTALLIAGGAIPASTYISSTLNFLDNLSPVGTFHLVWHKFVLSGQISPIPVMRIRLLIGIQPLQQFLMYVAGLPSSFPLVFVTVRFVTIFLFLAFHSELDMAYPELFLNIWDVGYFRVLYRPRLHLIGGLLPYSSGGRSIFGTREKQFI